ncbi:4a-hydroxytetrahydrobiopterin dehydratase [Acidihalobacter ferrooxydans]|uniref:Putative pterin-4-alpha-carbinolamine dehydratase n=1 Tax=Acidihalobacter ferrooxydans TaxID=1765967 RepID=A0A1P8UGB8_9GAMM|nr:4a-hydroxytetrahydrobiopterin dehydratase [Acidihalobacter ferrooxydans]APZ42869.1 4a-hydroxytetrahydrobiopterin dehydratase [Acidihalobacter ferrooxydans]
MTDLTQRHCIACEGGVQPLSREQAAALLRELHADWTLDADGREIAREFHFANYYETMAFVNAGAWISHQENHHPDLEVGYNRCRVRYSTHAIGGLSDNDFICAAKMDGLGV